VAPVAFMFGNFFTHLKGSTDIAQDQILNPLSSTRKMSLLDAYEAPST
jgi:hypothetical protein